MTNKQNRYILILACATFLFLGMATAGIGPVLPELANNANSSLTAIGGVLSALFLGALISQLTTGPLCDRIGHKKVLITSLLILSLGFLAFTTTHSLWLILGLTFFAGLGHGAVDLTTNLLVARVFHEKNVTVLNMLHFFFGLGAFSGPALISLSLKFTGSGLIILWISAAAMVVIAVLYSVVRGLPPVKMQTMDHQPAASVYRSSLVWVFGLLLLLHVGVENGMGGWTTTYTQATTGVKIETGALLSAGFWGLLTIGRLAGAAIGIKLSPQKILAICLSLSVAGGGLFVIGHSNLPLTVASVLLIGLSMGAVYPTVIAIITSRYPENPGKAASICAAMGSVGGVLIPWIQGFIMEQQSTQASTWFIAILMLVMLFIVFYLSRMLIGRSKFQAATSLD
jgi:fucose permease